MNIFVWRDEELGWWFEERANVDDEDLNDTGAA